MTVAGYGLGGSSSALFGRSCQRATAVEAAALLQRELVAKKAV